MKKILIGVGIIVVIAVVAVSLLMENLGSLIKKGVETAGPKILKADVRLSGVDISVSSGSGALKGLTVGNPAGYHTDYAFHLDSIKILLDPKSLTTDTIHIKQVLIEGPKVIYEGSLGKSNISQLEANAEAFAGGSKKAGKEEGGSATSGKSGKKVIIDSLKITGGDASLSMNVLQGQKVTVALPPIEMKDLGQDRKEDFASILQQVLSAVDKALVPAIRDRIAQLGLSGGVQEEAGKAKEEAQKGINTLKGIFGN